MKVIKVQILLQAALAAVVHRDRLQWCTGTGRNGAQGLATVVHGHQPRRCRALASVVHVRLEMVFPSNPSDVLARLISPG